MKSLFDAGVDGREITPVGTEVWMQLMVLKAQLGYKAKLFREPDGRDAIRVSLHPSYSNLV